MRAVAVAVCLVALFAVALSSKPRVSVKAAKDLLHRAPEGWERISAANPQHEMTVIFALKQRNLDQLDALFWDVSNPKSTAYGKYLSLEQVAELVQPAVETIEAVKTHVAQYNPSSVSLVGSRDMLVVKMRVAALETLFATTFHVFQSPERSHVSALGDYSLPNDIAQHVDFVSGVSGFPGPKHRPFYSTSTKRQSDQPVTPSVIRTRYNVSKSATGTNPNASQAVAEFQDQYYAPYDLTQFYQQYVGQKTNADVTKVVGQNDPSNPGDEASLDIQYIKGVAPDAPTWYWSIPSMDFWSDLTTWISQLNSEANCPIVHSISYGDQVALSDPWEGYQSRFNTEMQKLGVRGISIIFASGDSGTGCSACIWFSPSFPAISPYVTSVGATEFTDDTLTVEQAVTEFGSGGGFAWDFKAPSYQTSAIAGYFKNAPTLPEFFFYDKTGRGTPDVAALGMNFAVLIGGQTYSVGGTSASAPTFAGIVTLLNNIRLGNNKPALGFLNPFLYQAALTPGAYYDVTIGNNQDGCCGETGFVCAKGWDPVTGLGTPNFAVLSKLVAKLP